MNAKFNRLSPLNRLLSVVFMIMAMPIYHAFSQSEEFAFARKDELWGYINKNGEYAIDPIFDNILDFFVLEK